MRLKLALLSLCVLLGAGLAQPLRAQVATAEPLQLQIQRSEDGLLLSTTLKFELPPAAEEALQKGVPVIFVATTDIYRERWYWTEKKVAAVVRQMRLAYQPLTRRWRLAVGGESNLGHGLGMALSQTFDSLGDALTAIQRISGWRIADASALDAGTKYRVEFRFRLDVSQLPRPLQIGALGQNEWALSMSAVQMLTLENGK